MAARCICHGCGGVRGLPMRAKICDRPVVHARSMSGSRNGRYSKSRQAISHVYHKAHRIFERERERESECQLNWCCALALIPLSSLDGTWHASISSRQLVHSMPWPEAIISIASRNYIFSVHRIVYEVLAASAWAWRAAALRSFISPCLPFCPCH